MDSTVDYIARLLSVDPSLKLLEPAEEDSEPLELENELDEIDYVVIEDSRHEFSAGAVDGGQGTIIRNNVFQAGVYRAGYVKFRGGERTDEYSEKLLMVNLTRENCVEIYAEAFSHFHGGYPAWIPAFGETLGAMRRLAEEKAIIECLDNLKAGDLLLLDGSLRGDGYGFIQSMIKRAASRQINVASVAKANSLLWRGGANLAAVIRQRGDELHQKKSWYARVGRVAPEKDQSWLGNIYIAKLNPHSGITFRVDLSRSNKKPPSDIFAQLSGLATDPFFLGYPYPLAAVHQMVRLSEDELYGFMMRLQDIALQKGIEQSRWDLLFADYHRILNFDLRENQFRRL
ncbi:MAG TPA: DNA double-strand break repair nuclease NurA [candidate division Zixibacteria bacterium]|nr:DNA double-strand break repair nuclease NurA [candidate division Zixibacteria bacterium]